MTISILGFIGVGSLAEYTVSGLRLGGYQGRILLSPRNRERAHRLADKYHCEVFASNQAVVDASDCVILSTRPEHYETALSELTFKRDALLVSVVAGVNITALQRITGDEINIVRAMPVNCAEACASPTLIYPDSPSVATLFDFCGTSIPVPEEANFDHGSVLACVYTWFFALFQEVIDSTSSADLPPELATELVLGMAKGAASLALTRRADTPGEIATGIATEGTFSKQGLDLLTEKDAFTPWQQACDLLLKGMVKNDGPSAE